ncbi:hypothetical protein CspeluHIS016_0300150 [Cutaneotrichosporon spelunceum]|uniref:Uncharacterized protein n=1 Tax=Cutaneotrichosporon spelunceum TaxID=1672016 RepID=A0AAD3TSQ9_9TREE|nr:hypothetical protein CspeluHIS016_0300150 [Cutaneotrichosporon spelunceum]
MLCFAWCMRGQADEPEGGTSSPSVKSVEPARPVELLSGSGAPKITLTVPSREALTTLGAGDSASSPSRDSASNPTPSCSVTPANHGSSPAASRTPPRADSGTSVTALECVTSLESVPEEIVHMTWTVSAVDPEPPAARQVTCQEDVATRNPVKAAGVKEAPVSGVDEVPGTPELVASVEEAVPPGCTMAQVPERKPENQAEPAPELVTATNPSSEDIDAARSEDQSPQDAKAPAPNDDLDGTPRATPSTTPSIQCLGSPPRSDTVPVVDLTLDETDEGSSAAHDGGASAESSGKSTGVLKPKGMARSEAAVHTEDVSAPVAS